MQFLSFLTCKKRWFCLLCGSQTANGDDGGGGIVMVLPQLQFCGWIGLQVVIRYSRKISANRHAVTTQYSSFIFRWNYCSNQHVSNWKYLMTKIRGNRSEHKPQITRPHIAINSTASSTELMTSSMIIVMQRRYGARMPKHRATVYRHGTSDSLRFNFCFQNSYCCYHRNCHHVRMGRPFLWLDAMNSPIRAINSFGVLLSNPCRCVHANDERVEFVNEWVFSSPHQIGLSRFADSFRNF